MRAALALVLVAAVGCAETSYAPRVVARGELTLRYRDGAYEMWGGGQRVARGLGWRGLAGYVGCVGAARADAEGARRDGAASLGLAIAGGTLGVAALGGLYGFADSDHEWEWLGSGIAVAAVGVVLAASSRMLRNRANGRAIDAMNRYDDAVGSLGATCADLRYPPPAGPAPPPQAPPAFALPPPVPPPYAPPPQAAPPPQ